MCAYVCECVFHTCVGEKTICRHWIYQVDPEDPTWVLMHSIKCLKLPTHPLALKAVSKGHTYCMDCAISYERAARETVV